MIPVVGVRFKKAGKIYYFDPGECAVDVGMQVIVETAQGVECGEIAVGAKLVPADDLVQPVRRIMRVASPEDVSQMGSDRKHEKEAFMFACARVKELALDMKVVDAEWTFDRQKLVFYFISDVRVDFRELVKELAAQFRTRIELRQIGVRDQSKMLGGYGVCGRALCCATWIGDFEPISIRHAKDQDLSLNPSKISGVCGRLKCCLRFEADVYNEIRQRMPKVGTIVWTPQGSGRVIEIHVIKERLTVRIDDGDEFRRVEIGLDELEWGAKPPQELAEVEHAAAATVHEHDTVVADVKKSARKPREQENHEMVDGTQPRAPKSKKANARRPRRPRQRRSASPKARGDEGA